MTPTELAFIVGPPLALAAAVAHSLTVRGPDITRPIFFWALLFFTLKGGIDVTRPPGSIPFEMQVHFLDYGQRNQGIHLLVFPMLRATFAYVGLTVAERVAMRLDEAPYGLFRLCGTSLAVYCMLGVVCELVNESTHWWYWTNDDVEAGIIHYLFTWSIWGGGFFEAMFLYFVQWKRIQAPGKVSAFYVLGYYTVVTVLYAIMPPLQILVLVSFSMLVMLSGFVRRGPRLRPLH